MGSFWTDNAPTNTGVTGGNLGGFQPTTAAPNGAPPGYIPPGVLYGGGASDPHVSSFAPWQDGSRATDNVYRPPQNDPRLTTQPQPYQQGPGGTLGQMPGPYSPDMGSWIQSQMSAHRRDPNQGSAPERLNPEIQQYLQSHGRGGFIPFGGGIAKGPNGGFVNPGDGSPYQGGSSLGQMGSNPMQPMNPGQQSGQVGMRSPDGQHFQYVNAEHVPHYQGLGAQIYNGSSYGGGNG